MSAADTYELPPVRMTQRGFARIAGPASLWEALLFVLQRGWTFPLLFLTLTFPLGLFLAAVTPIGGVADELAHAVRAESVSEGRILGHRAPELLPSGGTRLSAGVDADPGIFGAAELEYPSPHTSAAAIAKARSAGWTGTRGYIQITPLAVYFPVLYFPAALGMLAAKIAGAGPAGACMVARLVNLVTFAAIAIAALLLARRGRGLLFCVLSLPMTISLAASLNPDGLLIGSSVLAAASLTRAAETESHGAGASLSRSRIGAAVAIGLIALAKIPYAGLAALLLLPEPVPDRALLRRSALAAVAVAPGVLWLAYAMIKIAAPVGWDLTTEQYAPGPLWPGPDGVMFHSADAAAQLRVLAANPLRIISLTWNTISHSPWIIPTMIGVLGPLSIVLPQQFYLIWKLALASVCAGVALGGGREWRVQFDWRSAAVVAVVICQGVIAIYMSQYLTWTRVGAAQVEGPVGRYLLPLLPALVLSLPVLRGPGLLRLRAVLLIPAAIALCAGMIVVPRAIVEGFYLHQGTQ